jgi:GxxExxY protein
MRDEAFVDDQMEPDPELNRLTNLIIGAAIEVHRHLGPGHLESAYEEALAIEFDLRNIPFERQQAVHLQYKGHDVGKGRLDFLVFGKIILDTKAVESLCSTHTAQMISYLRVAGLKLGLIINFNVRVLKDGIRRIAN